MTDTPQALPPLPTEDQCDQLVAKVMDNIAAKASDQYGTVHALDLNPSITEHHTLRRGLVRAAYMLGVIEALAAQQGAQPRSQKMREAGFTARDNRLTCDECGAKFTAQFAPLHKCETPAAQAEPVAWMWTPKGEFYKPEGEDATPLYAAPQAAEPPEDWLHLKQYGYAPGGYMSKCHRCGATPIMDKRAVTCRPCAEAMHKAAQAQPQEPPRSAPLTEEQILQVKDRILNTVTVKGESPELLRSAIAHRVVSLLRGISTPEEQR